MKNSMANIDKQMDECVPEATVRLDVLMELYFKQLITFAAYLDNSGLVPVEKYADFVIYAMRKRLEKESPKLKRSCIYCGSKNEN
jgi:hypothetical protein